MKLREQVGQLLIMGFEGVSFSARLPRLFAELHPGGVILFSRNLEAAAQTHALLRDCRQAVSTPMFLCVDMEGGTVDRLKNVIAPAPAAAEVFASRNRKLFRRHGELIGKECRLLGFNTDFAPATDLAFPASRPVLGSRAVSVDPRQVVIYAREFLRGLRDSRILGCGKHFPGLGEANLDSHCGLPTVSKPWKLLWAQDLVPYRALRKQMPFVMVSHANYPEISHEDRPASLSPKWMSEILRKKIGYRGLIISDDLEMGGALAAGSIEHAAVETIRAGADIFLVCHQEEMVRHAWEAVLREAERDKNFARRVAESAHRVLMFKKRWRPLKYFPLAPAAKRVENLRQEIQNFAHVISQKNTIL